MHIQSLWLERGTDVSSCGSCSCSSNIIGAHIEPHFKTKGLSFLPGVRGNICPSNFILISWVDAGIFFAVISSIFLSISVSNSSFFRVVKKIMHCIDLCTRSAFTLVIPLLSHFCWRYSPDSRVRSAFFLPRCHSLFILITLQLTVTHLFSLAVFTGMCTAWWATSCSPLVGDLVLCFTEFVLFLLLHFFRASNYLGLPSLPVSVSPLYSILSAYS